MALADYDTDPDGNDAVLGVDIGEDCAPGNLNNAVRQVCADLAAWLLNAVLGPLTIAGNVLMSEAAPTIMFNASGPRLKSTGTNRLSIFTDSNDRARMTFASGGAVMVPGGRIVTGAEDLQGSGSLRVYAASAGGYAVTTYDTQDYTAVQFVRDVSATPTQVGTITCTASATAYGTVSDERQKENFRPFDSGSILDNLWVGAFDFKVGGSGYGVRAQQAYEFFPEAIVKGYGDASWQADYSKFVPLLLNEIKALRVRVEALEAA